MRYRRKQRSPRRAGEAGFTLIEIMVAMLLLSIILAGSMAMQVAVITASANARASAAATSLAQTRIEEFRATRYLSLAAADETACFDYDTKLVSTCVPVCTCSTYFQRDTTITAITVPTDGFNALVTVSWKTAAGTRQVSFETERTP